ncbi:hypothetical protein A134_23090 [Vibrio crassostreae 9CS106]|uniref:Uncharacterized protein n=1 Tax=Vibrio crassostreae 9CS106 TaxID=1191300 RepID=A0A1B1C3E0_9VIBR|nr:hypothetical protein A134_23090 [Vibrio crassostreae 9CS106]
MSYTKQQLDNLKASYARGVLKVREGDTWVEYASLSQMHLAILNIERELGTSKVPSGTRRLRVKRARFYGVGR